MSAQMLTREALFAWASVDDASITCRLARSARAYMRTLDAAIVERNEAYRQRDNYELQIIDARAILGAAPDELLSDAAARVMVDLGDMTLAEAEPPQVFRPPISVTIHHVTGHAFAEVEVGDITDPAFLSLPMGARLGLVVCDG